MTNIVFEIYCKERRKRKKRNSRRKSHKKYKRLCAIKVHCYQVERGVVCGISKKQK